MPVTRTLGPLHFEDLDPKRFEDLVRQLVYDFKRWRRLEATGRAGSDDGFDARGYEITRDDEPNEHDDEVSLPESSDRLWLVQCKRERTIAPTKLGAYLNDTKLSQDERLLGIVFAAACDFSKRARDVFRDRCEELGIQEWHLWGKAELEDLLYQPRNDALLFAYLGISITIRLRSQKTELRARLATKRKANRILEGYSHRTILIRNPEATAYPYSSEVTNFEKCPQWVVAQYAGLNHSGLLFTVRRHFAFLDDSNTLWDAAFAHNDAHQQNNPWTDRQEDSELRQKIYTFWSELPKQNQAWFELKGVIPYDAILDIDEIGDEYIDAPHIYAPFNPLSGPYTDYIASVTSANTYIGGIYYPQSRTDNNRITKFKTELRVEKIINPYEGSPHKETGD